MMAGTNHGSTTLPRTLRERFGIVTTRDRVWRAIVNGEVPAAKGPDGRWYVAEEHVGRLAEALRLRVARSGPELPPAA